MGEVDRARGAQRPDRVVDPRERVLVVLCIAEGAGEFRGDVRNVLVANGTALERNALGRQILADSSSMDVIVDGDSAEEGTSRGVAMMLAASL